MHHKKVDFVIAGQPKSGTTALAQFLAEHPQVCMSYPKEPAYFATDFMKESDAFHGKPKYFRVRTPEQYDRHFSHCEEGQMLGEASTCYTYSKDAAHNIYRHNPEAKIIIMLREPVDFMHSLHMQYVNDTIENETNFEKALELERERKKGNYIPSRTRCPSYNCYRERARYSDHIKRFLDIFGKERVMIIANEEFREDNQKIYQQILDFLYVTNDEMPDFKTVHNSKTPRVSWLNKLVHVMWVKKMLYNLLGPAVYTNIQKGVNRLLLKPQKRDDINPELRLRLREQLRPEVSKLSKLTNKDFLRIWKYEE